jgi:hypothetical protein
MKRSTAGVCNTLSANVADMQSLHLNVCMFVCRLHLIEYHCLAKAV